MTNKLTKLFPPLICAVPGAAATLIIILFCTVLGTATTAAENYPYRSDYLWVTTPNHADWLYKTGEDATIEVQFYKYGIPQNCEVSYEIAPDMLPAYKTGKVTLKNGRATINIGTRKTPGFLDLCLTVKETSNPSPLNSQLSKHHVKVGFSVDKIQPYAQFPKDFKDFWISTIAEARKTPLSYTRELATEYCTDRVDCWLVKLKIDRSHYMYGYLTMPKNSSRQTTSAPSLSSGEKAGDFSSTDKSRGCPACLCPPGAGIKTIKQPLRHKYYAEDGFIRLECEIHGIDPRLSEEKFKEVSSAFCNGDDSYFHDRYDNREAYYMRHIYVGMIRWMDFLRSLPEWDGKNLCVQGGSQGGALALVTAGLLSILPPDSQSSSLRSSSAGLQGKNPQPSSLNILCCANHPALTDMAAYSQDGRTGGYPHFRKAELTPQVQQCLQYYDIINFCRIIKCPVRMTWGYNDSTCPPTTSYAAWNTLNENSINPHPSSLRSSSADLQGKNQSVITPINEHWTSETMEQQHEQWLKSNLK